MHFPPLSDPEPEAHPFDAGFPARSLNPLLGVPYFTFGVIYIIIFALILFISVFKLPFYIDLTVGLINTNSRVSIEEKEEVKGSFNMAYVNEVRATIPLYIVSLFNKNWDIVKEEELTHGDMTVDEVIEYGRITMKESNKDAIFLAYKKADRKSVV